MYIKKKTFSLCTLHRNTYASIFVSPSVRQSVSPSVCQSVSPSVRQSVSPSVRQSVSMSDKLKDGGSNIEAYMYYNVKKSEKVF